MKVAYLLLVHENPQLLKRAIEMLSCGGCEFFIHLDLTSDMHRFDSNRRQNVHFVEPRLRVHWGEFSQVEATMLLLRQALGSSANYDYFIFLQGSDYPLRSGAYIRNFLEENRGSEFLSLARMPAPGYPLSKINKLRYPSDKPVWRFTSRALGKLGSAQRDYTKYLGGLYAFAGQAWWALSKDACQFIVDFASSNPHVEKYFRNTFTADEMFFHTILGNSPFFDRLRRNLVFVDATWSIHGNQRHRITERHVSFFGSQEKVLIDDEWGSVEALFARKFFDDDLDLIDRINAMIGRKEGQHIRSSRL